jgi:hypothetical protein
MNSLQHNALHEPVPASDVLLAIISPLSDNGKWPQSDAADGNASAFSSIALRAKVVNYTQAQGRSPIDLEDHPAAASITVGGAADRPGDHHLHLMSQNYNVI